MRWFHLAYGLFVILWLRDAMLAATNCEPLSEDTAARLAKYVHDKLNFPQTITLRVDKVDPIGDTCFRRVQFRPREQDTGLKIVVYVSPDNRFLSRDLLDTTVSPAEERRQAQERAQKGLAQGAFPSKGPATAPMTIVMFSDFQCSYCKLAVDVLTRALGEDRNKVRIVFRHLPLPGHSWARQAAEMAACAHKQNDEAFWHFHDFIFNHQPEITNDNLSQKIMGILRGRVDMEQYQTCVAEHQEAPQINEDIAFAAEQRIRATPTLFINGQRKEGVPEFSEIRDLVQQYVGSLAGRRP